MTPLVKVEHTWFKSMVEPVIGTSLFIQVNPSKPPSHKKEAFKMQCKPVPGEGESDHSDDSNKDFMEQLGVLKERNERKPSLKADFDASKRI